MSTELAKYKAYAEAIDLLHRAEPSGDCCRVGNPLECMGCAGEIEGHNALYPCETAKLKDMLK
jgi:hypothetical protein